MSDEWKFRGACRDVVDRDHMFPRELHLERERAALCRACPVIRECLGYALDTGQEYGVWGGRTARERRALLNHHPRITSWTDLFRSA